METCQTLVASYVPHVNRPEHSFLLHDQFDSCVLVMNGTNCYFAGCIANCEECVNGFDCNKCVSGTSKIVQGSHTTCVNSCPFGYTNHENAKTGNACLLNR